MYAIIMPGYMLLMSNIC